MSTEPVFFSYSRADGEFVLKLAKDLRKAGVNIWLDQLDIKAGSRWDASIEAALNASSILIVILTPTSVASNNVMDEVSFALENNKLVIPVLFTNCTVPFRLRRLQQVNFTGEYQSALQQLVNQLGYAAAANEQPAVLNSQLPVNAINSEQPSVTVTEVFYCNADKSNIGSFKFKKNKTWREENSDGLVTWNEISRNENKIHLDGNGRYNCILDLASEEVMLSQDAGESWFVLYFITGYK